VKHVVRRQAALAGRVVDSATGKPLRGVRIDLVAVPAPLQRVLELKRLRHGAAWERLDDRPDRTRTDVAGMFAFLDLPSGAYGLAASLPAGGRRYGPGKGKATIKRNRAGDVALAWVELELPATSVAGKVSDPGSKPVVLASVQVKGGPERVYTDSRGRYLLAGVESGPRTLVVTARGFQPAEQPVELAKPGASKTVNVTLTPSTS
jgi:hypothetical protein